MMRLACYQPEIAGNMGAVLRLAACFGTPVDVVEPCGFVWSDAKMRRAGMDYAQHVPVTHHADWAALRGSARGRIVLLTTHATLRLPDFAFWPDDILLLGQESAGVPAEIADACDAAVRIPIGSEVRSLNLAVAAAIALYEAQRQTGGLPG
jgi:tRNA (cytidine/uridine-2'-O-)-methyltransferase